MRPGLCVTPTFLPAADELAQLQPAYLRSLLYSLADLETLLATGLPLLLTANNECHEVGGDWSGWDGVMAEIAQRGAGRVLGVCVGNEFDLFWANNPNDVPPAFAADLARRAAAILRPAGIQTIATSVAGPRWQDYLQEVAGLLGDEVDAYDLHPYGQRPGGWGSPGWGWGDLRVAIGRAYELTGGRPIVFSEYGVKVGDAGGEADQAAFLAAAASEISALGEHVIPFWSWFAWTDAIGTPEELASGAGFGLVRADGSRRPSWQTYANLAPAASHEDTGGNPDPVPMLPKETPMPEPAPVPLPAIVTLDDVRRLRWQAIVPSAPYNPELGFERYWIEHPELGSPLTASELTLDTGEACRPFANKILVWKGDHVEEVA